MCHRSSSDRQWCELHNAPYPARERSRLCVAGQARAATASWGRASDSWTQATPHTASDLERMLPGLTR